jgi:hypothetical protein
MTLNGRLKTNEEGLDHVQTFARRDGGKPKKQHTTRIVDK